MALVLLLLVRFAGSSRAAFGGGSFEQVEGAVADAGLQVCDRLADPDGYANQAVATRAYDVAVDCAEGGVAQVVVDEFADAAHRDAAVRHFESQVRPRGSGVAYTLGRFSVFVLGHGDDTAQDRLGTTLRTAGAR